MPKIGFLKSVLGQKDRLPVKVGGKTELMTHTQSFRFNELQDPTSPSRTETYRNPLDEEHYSLEDAAFRLMLSEDDVLRKAAVGNIRLFIDVAGQAGHWRRLGPDGVVTRSSAGLISCGLLKLRKRACLELAKTGRAIVSTLDFCRKTGVTQSGIDQATLDNLRAWGPGDKQFFPLHPLNVERNMLVLLPPLALR